ncbi:acyltransferase family protein [Hydrogenophaga sp. RAC07]|uniref:acyltransferase family protein n=1 Tax=Hydrogenophaga sp. RAC07 TaxID=1842537 RepID=UPI00083E2C59|nr:acyltransferase [Hydrogenophaga sp. RAC07]AOF86370.1 acyltransferase family protein [Hydrogenophaga sp. RAC07]
MSRNPKFQQHIHVFRAIAIILIVSAHSIPSLDWSESPLLGRFLDGIANEASIFFFFIAGYLFQHLSERFSYQSYLLQKFKTVILPYLIISIPSLYLFTMVVERTNMWPWFYELHTWQQVSLFLLTGKHLAPLWFVPTITLFYLAAPVFIYIDRKIPRVYWLILPLWILAIYNGRNGPIGPIEKALYLLPVYLLGMVTSSYRDQAEELIKKFWIPLLVVSLLGFAGYTLDYKEPPYFLMVMKLPMALLMVIALLKVYPVFGDRLNYIAEISFGIFFIHAYFISFVKVVATYFVDGRAYDGEDAYLIEGTLLNLSIYVVIVLIASVGSIWVCKRVLGRRSRFVVGA